MNSSTPTSDEAMEYEANSLLVDFIEALEKIDQDSDIAKLNETSISDNNGGRIKL
ncbi:MAG TPA: hypothetical protein VMR75_02685 [Candidatus Saccharimonadales bacterium]|nr:hypothetical protein [Candidatus Saccharimonadales bacterium]